MVRVRIRQNLAPHVYATARPCRIRRGIWTEASERLDTVPPEFPGPVQHRRMWHRSGTIAPGQVSFIADEVEIELAAHQSVARRMRDADDVSKFDKTPVALAIRTTFPDLVPHQPRSRYPNTSWPVCTHRVDAERSRIRRGVPRRTADRRTVAARVGSPSGSASPPHRGFVVCHGRRPDQAEGCEVGRWDRGPRRPARAGPPAEAVPGTGAVLLGDLLAAWPQRGSSWESSVPSSQSRGRSQAGPVGSKRPARIDAGDRGEATCTPCREQECGAHRREQRRRPEIVVPGVERQSAT